MFFLRVLRVLRGFKRLTFPTILLASLSACTLADLTRPEGNGGWSPERRRAELDARARAAGADFDTPATPATEIHGSAPPALDGPLDLPSALALASRDNRAIGTARRQVAAAAARVRDARGRLLPATAASGRYTWYTDPQSTEVALPGDLLEQFGIPPPVVEVRDAEAGVVNANATLPFDLSGELRHFLRAAQAGYRGEQARLWATTLEEQARVVRAYFALLEAQRLHDVVALTIALDREQLGNAQQRFDSGRLTKNELLVVQVALRDAEQLQLQRQLAIDRARRELNQVVGLPVNAPTEVADVRTPPVVPASGEMLRHAYRHNPVVHGLIEEQQRLDATVTSLVRSRLPRFQGGGAFDYTSSDILQPQEIGSGFVGFSIDLGTDLRREAQIAEARAQAERNRLALEARLRELEAAVRGTRDAAAERLAALAAAEAAVGQAEENLRIRQQQFDAGRAQSEDVLDAEALLSGQRATLATARYQAHTRRAELQQLVGLPLEELWVEPSNPLIGEP